MTEQEGTPEKPLERKAEPEGGPGEREREFLEEHMTPLTPKGAPRPPAPVIPKEPGQPPEESPLPPDFRRQLVQDYRRRQQAQQRPPEPSERGAEEPEQPEAPQPPPANNWIPIGPTVVRQGQGGVKPATSARTPAIAVAPGGNRIYIGAANGGVWRSDDAGQTWRSLMDAFDLNPLTPASDSLSIGALAIDLANPDRVYVGSGEGDGAAYFGVGPIVTNNGTANPPAWNTELAAPGSPSLAGTAFYALAVDPANTDRVVAATYLGVYRREPNSTGGFQWAQKTLGGVGTQRVTSVVVAASGGTTTFYAALRGGPVYSSTDGHTWNQIGAGFPPVVGRISLAVQRDNPNVVYALIQNGGVYRLDVSDGIWRNITGAPAGFTGTQGWYDLAIAVAPDNVNRIYLGGSTVSSGGDWSGSLYRCEVAVSGTNVGMTPTYIGNSIHADVHTLVFAPGDANKLWVGCDGGVFSSINPTGTGDVFTARNMGLQTLTMEYLGQHPTEDAVLFCGTQDNGGLRFTGEEAWLYSSGGDSGYAIVNWNDPYKVLTTYVYGCIRRSTNGGQRYAYSGVSVPMVDSNCNPLEPCLFYAPIAGTPRNPGSPTAAADADLVAFGSIRPWISTTFGGGWQSIPNNTLAGDSLNGPIRSLTFASPTRLYAGTVNGGVYRFDRAGATWTRTQIDTIGGANHLPLAGSVTDIAVDPTDSSRIYITFGGWGDYRHVWHFDGAQWQQRSGPAAGDPNSLLDVMANAIEVDPDNPTHLYVGADIGVWRSTDGGANWAPFSQGLPDAAVVDLVLHDPRRLLRAATHGRGVYERTLPDTAKQGVELYIRSTQLDQGRFPAANDLPDPTAPGQTVKFWRGPDIKLDTPDVTGQYQFPLTGAIDLLQFVDTLSDDFQNVATHATANIVTRVYVQVHNRGVIPANNVRVMLLLANASAGLPPLPSGFEVNVRNGLPINTADWRTVGIDTLNDVRVGFPKIAAFSLPSSMLPPPANLAGNQHQCVLALVHHADDQFTNAQTNVDMLSSGDRKVAHKNLTVVQFTGTLPPVIPVVIPVRIHDAYLEERLLTSFFVNLNGYPGRVRLLIPLVKTEGDLRKLIEGMSFGEVSEDMRRWAESQVQMISRNQRSKRRYDQLWSKQRIEDIRQAMETGVLLEAKSKKSIVLNRIVMDPGTYHTLYLVFDRPSEGKIGQAYDIEIRQIDVKRERVIGGLSVRVELVPEPGSKTLPLIRGALSGVRVR
jgi:photosystem II stability/assembly factor-like uncharacterized protein